MLHIDWTYLRLKPRMRQFLSHWGAIGQANGDWGVDFTNVVYTSAWHYLCSECAGDSFKAKVITGLKNGGNMVEMQFGLMYLTEAGFATYADFENSCIGNDMSWAKDQYMPAWSFLIAHRSYLKTLSTWRATLEQFVKSWHSLLHGHCIGTFRAWTTNKTFDGPRIANAYECLRMGWPPNHTQLFEFWFQSAKPPCSFLLYDRTYQTHAPDASTAHDGSPIP